MVPTHSSICYRVMNAHTHLTATLSARLVAVRVGALICLTATGAAGLVTPPTSGTRQISPAGKHVISLTAD